MLSRLITWWEEGLEDIIHFGKKQNAIKLLGILILLMCGLFIGGAYVFHWSWTGFVMQSSSANTQTTKTLWDWMSLLIIPVILALVGILFTRSERKTEQIIAYRRTENEQAAARDNQQEAALQGYLDRMSDLLLEKKLRESKPGDEVRNVARVRTLTMFYQLDIRRINYLLAFLRDSGLVTPRADTSIITFSQADLVKIDLKGVNLSGLDLAEVNFTRAKLQGASFKGADLRGVNFKGADLTEADLSEANLSEAYLAGTDLTRANFQGANLQRATFREPGNIRGQFYRDVPGIIVDVTYGPNITKTYEVIEGAGMASQGVGLDIAFVSFAHLESTDLRGANLQGASLCKLDLEGAIIDKASLDTAPLTKEERDTLSVDKHEYVR